MADGEHHSCANAKLRASALRSSFPPSRPVFPFPVHWPELGVDLGLDYCHPLLIYHWPELGVDLGLDHWHQPLPGLLMKQTSLLIFIILCIIANCEFCLLFAVCCFVLFLSQDAASDARPTPTRPLCRHLTRRQYHQSSL